MCFTYTHDVNTTSRRLLGRRVTSVNYISIKSPWDIVVNGWWEPRARWRPSHALLFQVQPQNPKPELCPQVPSGPLHLAPCWKQSGLLMLVRTREMKQGGKSKPHVWVPSFLDCQWNMDGRPQPRQMPVTLHFHGFGNFGSGSLYVGTPLSIEILGECRAKKEWSRCWVRAVSQGRPGPASFRCSHLDRALLHGVS